MDRLTLLREIRAFADYFGLDLAQVLQEKRNELAQRWFLTLIPTRNLQDWEVSGFLTRRIGRTPEADLLERVFRAWQQTQRQRRLSEEEFMSLEESQNSRCATCGRLLDASAQSHADHIIPLALGGADDMGNLQLLCGPCNLGKGTVVGWELSPPYGQVTISSRVRYVALRRDGSACQEGGCARTSRDAHLDIGLQIPSSAGGRRILDNTITLCRYHLHQRQLQARRNALRAMTLSRRLGTVHVRRTRAEVARHSH